MGADSRISFIDPNSMQILEVQDNIQKIHFYESCSVGISYWGLAEIRNQFGSIIPMIDFISEFEHRMLESTDSVIDVSRKIKDEMENIRPKIHTRVGFHIVGYIEDELGNPVPHLRHLFHDGCHEDGEFENENCHEEYHYNCEKVPFTHSVPFPVLFNGDNSIANCLFNYIPSVRKETIRNDLMSLEECVDLTKIILGLSIQRLNYYYNINEERIPQTIGGPTDILLLKPDGTFRWISDTVHNSNS